MSSYHCLDELQQWLDSYLNFEKTPQKNIFWLDTMEFLCKKLGRPEHAAPAFHIAGSKGKGSVSAFISSILDAAGYRVGLYTSPHIVAFVERIGSAHGAFSEAVYQAASDELMQAINGLKSDELPGGRRLTWFELVTLYAFLCFRRAQVDYGVYEVGLGGRLDSTNVLSPLACCITPIELEHTEFLGNTLEAIAAEKGGIIKPATPVFVAAQQPPVKAVFRRIAAVQNAPILFIDEQNMSTKLDYSSAFSDAHEAHDASGAFGMQLELRAPQFSRPLTARLRLLGEFQAQNAALAAVAVKSALPSISEDAIERGLSAAVLPGRFELVPPPRAYAGIRALVLDGAHTVHSVAGTLKTFRALFAERNAHLLFACAADKDMAHIARLFSGAASNGKSNHTKHAVTFTHLTLTKPGNAKQSNLASLCRAFDDAGLHYAYNEDYVAAIRDALAAAAKANAVLLVTGSFYLLAEVKKLLAA